MCMRIVLLASRIGCVFRASMWIGLIWNASMITTSKTRGKFTRIFVEIDLTKPLDANIKMEVHLYQLQYEGLHLVCFGCGRCGHGKDTYPATRTIHNTHTACSTATLSTSEALSSCTLPNASTIPSVQPGVSSQSTAIRLKGNYSTLLKPWNLMQPRRRRRSSKQADPSPASSASLPSSRFSAQENVHEVSSTLSEHHDQDKAPYVLSHTAPSHHQSFTFSNAQSSFVTETTGYAMEPCTMRLQTDKGKSINQPNSPVHSMSQTNSSRMGSAEFINKASLPPLQLVPWFKVSICLQACLAPSPLTLHILIRITPRSFNNSLSQHN